LAGRILAGIPDGVLARKNHDAGRRITLTRFLHPFHRLEKDVPVRHEDKEALRINKRSEMRRMRAGSILLPSDCALFDVVQFTTPGAIDI